MQLLNSLGRGGTGASIPVSILGILILMFFFWPQEAKAGKDYSLARTIERALQENFSIVSAESEKQAAESGRKSARGNFGPELGTSYSYAHRQRIDDDLYSWRVWLRQDIFSGFSTLASYQKASLQQDNAEASLKKARLALVYQVQQNFFLYLKATENIRSANDSLNRLIEQLKVTKSFYDVGLRPRLDVLQAEVNVSEAEDSLLRAKNTAEVQRARLNTLLNLPLDSDIVYVGTLDYIPFYGTLEQCLAQAYQMRPDVVIAAKTVEIARKDKLSAASGYYPRIQAEGAWSSEGDGWKVQGSDSKPTKYNNWAINVTGSYSVFESGRTFYTVQQRQHLIAKVQADEANLKQDVAFEVQSRMLDLGNASKRIKVARKGLEQAREAYRVASARYKSQVGTSIDVLDAHAKITAAEASLTGAQADYLIALAALYSAMGEENLDLMPSAISEAR